MTSVYRIRPRRSVTHGLLARFEWQESFHRDPPDPFSLSPLLRTCSITPRSRSHRDLAMGRWSRNGVGGRDRPGWDRTSHPVVTRHVLVHDEPRSGVSDRRGSRRSSRRGSKAGIQAAHAPRLARQLDLRRHAYRKYCRLSSHLVGLLLFDIVVLLMYCHLQTRGRSRLTLSFTRMSSSPDRSTVDSDRAYLLQ